MDYKGLRDNHLNVFWSYGGNPDLENDITKAFINTIDGMSVSQKEILFKELFGIEISGLKCSFKYYLQRKGNTLSSEVSKIPESNRIMFCFSPNPDHKGYKGQDTNDWDIVSEDIRKEVEKEYPNDKKTQDFEFGKRLSECKRSAARDGSIPDACVFIYVNDVPTYVIAMENKLYSLDPYQINNHIEKSLLIVDGSKKKKPIYKGYKEICSILESKSFCDTWICQQYLEYMTILHYRKPEKFISICDAEPKLRQWLATNFFGEELVSKLHDGKPDKRNWCTWRINVNYEYLKEINLVFKANEKCESIGVGISLCFGSTQYTARKMIESIDSVKLRNKNIWYYGRGMHLFRYPCNNVKVSYTGFNRDAAYDLEHMNEYIDYWKKHIDMIPTKIITSEEAISIYSRLVDEGIVEKEKFDDLKNTILYRYKNTNRYTFVPEIEIMWYWSYEEILQIEEDAFTKQMIDAVNETLKEMKLK